MDQVKSAWGTANSYLGAKSNQAQAAFQAHAPDAAPPSSAVIDRWNDSELREFLLKHNIISPSSKTEELRILAKQKYDELFGDSYSARASATVSSAYAQATDAISEAYYASADAPQLAYDYLSNAFDGK